MLRVLRENGSPAPIFETDDDRAALVLRLPVHPEDLAVHAASTGGLNPPLSATGGVTGATNTPPVTSQDNILLAKLMEFFSDDLRGGTPQVTPQVAKVIETLLRAAETERTRADLQRETGLADREYFSLHYLQPLLHAGLLELTLPEKPNSRLQKYRLTAKGRVLLD